MSDSASVEEYRKRSLERVTAFTDAAVAIALTLLVLPLVDLATDTEAGQPVVLSEHLGDLLGYVVSFLVIAQVWNGHRRLFETLDVYDERLLTINTWWLLFVVFLPYPTARLFVASRVDRGGAVLYLGTLLVISLLGLALSWYAARHRELRRPDLPPVPVRDQIRVNVGTCVVMAIGLGLAFVRPELGLYALLLLVLTGGRPRFRRRAAH